MKIKIIFNSSETDTIFARYVKNWLILFMIIIAMYSENHMEQVHRVGKI
jgi:hypothetical protein